jgi:uncharacterized coiled-coil protein SlyX
MTTPTEPKRPSIDELEAMINETDETIAEVRAELERRRAEKQHLAIDELEQRLAEAKPKWAEVRAFFQLVLQDLRK